VQIPEEDEFEDEPEPQSLDMDGVGLCNAAQKEQTKKQTARGGRGSQSAKVRPFLADFKVT
jgi:hypothetical protein